LTLEEVQQLATLHGRSIKQEPVPSPEPPPAPPIQPEKPAHLQPESHLPSTFRVDADVVSSLSSLEATVANLQQQVAQLALELVHERELRYERRLSTLEALMQQIIAPSERQPEASVLAVNGLPDQPSPAGRSLNPAELRARSRVISLVEYTSGGTYVVICPQEGELFFAPDSPEWFDWLACLSSFRFVGQFGRFTAYRDSSRSGPRRCWSAVCCFHGRRYKCYLGTTDHLTVSVLEQAAASLQSHMAAC
jgi:hypothetical protein